MNKHLQGGGSKMILQEDADTYFLPAPCQIKVMKKITQNVPESKNKNLK